MTQTSERPRTAGAARRPKTASSAATAAKAIRALAERSAERPHTPALEREAERLAAQPDRHRRTDLRALPTFTIDGASTQDFDDALSARREGGDVRVWIHVADVAAIVRPGGRLDEEARRRATSVYLPGLTVPMLPAALSAGVCSLMPGEDRAALTVEVLLRAGVVRERRIYRSLIRSDARLTYDQVDEIFLGRAEPGPTYRAALSAARRAAFDRAHETAERDGARDEEPVFTFREGDVVSMEMRAATESHRLIERLMILANVLVAEYLHERGVPALYRTHGEGDPEARFPPPAAYERELSPHAGLGVAAYCHFTSPIRRYADLLVHRALLAEIGAEPFDTAPRHVRLPVVAGHLNDRTRTAKRLERRAEGICRVSLLRRRLAEGAVRRDGLTGTVSGVAEHGLYVAVDCVEGMINVRDAGGGRPGDDGAHWIAPDGTVTRVGDEIAVSIRTVDATRGRVRLVPARAPAAGQPLR